MLPRSRRARKAEGEFERLMAELNLKQMVTPPADCARDIVGASKQARGASSWGNGAEDLFMLSRAEPDEYGSILKQKLGL